MILFPAIWWLFPAASTLLLVGSFFLTRSGNRESAAPQKIFVALGALLGFLALALPLFEQPVFFVPLINYGLGIPLAAIGLVGRVYPMVYLQRQGTTTAMDSVVKLVSSGPYAWVRHPQYSAGFVLLLGWFLLWGAWYALGFMPIITGVIYAQALIEEKYILEKKFGETYAAYRERVGLLLPNLVENNPLRITASFLGIYAGLITIQHGIFEIMQGGRSPERLFFHAIGPPCQPENAWHACFPAMTMIPDLLVTGIASVLAGLGMAVWAAVFIRRKCGGFVLVLLSLLALLVGGGFVPVFIGIVSAATNRGPVRIPARNRFAFLAVVWPWPLILMTLWLPGSWLLGHFFGPVMLSLSGPLFLIFDIGLPALAMTSAISRTL
jgi:protein-S-isoprenylcysteine O-methyltransferase Ste14